MAFYAVDDDEEVDAELQANAHARHEVPWPHRELWRSVQVAHQDEFGDPDDSPYNTDEPEEARKQVEARDANLISSRCRNGKHAPVLDIDFEARLLPSRTEGHYHLYLDKQMPWWKYRILLKVLAWTGIIEPGYYGASVERKMTFLRWNFWDAVMYENEGDLVSRSMRRRWAAARLQVIERSLRK